VIEAINPLVAGTQPAFANKTDVSVNQPVPTGFGDMMTQLATTAITRVEQAEQASLAKISGVEIPVREIVDKVMAAQQALNTTLAIRDKIVQAYIEISHTQI